MDAAQAQDQRPARRVDLPLDEPQVRREDPLPADGADGEGAAPGDVHGLRGGGPRDAEAHHGRRALRQLLGARARAAARREVGLGAGEVHEEAEGHEQSRRESDGR